MTDAPEQLPTTLDVGQVGEVTTIDGVVTVILHVSLFDSPSHGGRILLNISYEDADELLVRLQRAVVSARANR